MSEPQMFNLRLLDSEDKDKINLQNAEPSCPKTHQRRLQSSAALP
jgi:hypothetical protein